MSGIFCIIYKKGTDLIEINELLLRIEDSLKRRGDDFNMMRAETDKYKLEFKASILKLNDKYKLEQPYKQGDCVLTLNGEDAEFKCPDLHCLECLVRSVKILQGPFAFIYFNEILNTLYCSRDRLGCCSLLIGVKNDILIITSVALKICGFRFMELPPLGVFGFNLRTETYNLKPWSDAVEDFFLQKQKLDMFLDQEVKTLYIPPYSLQNTNINKDELPYIPDNHVSLLDGLRFFTTNSVWLEKIKHLNDLLETSIKKRLTNLKFCRYCFPIGSNEPCNHSRVGLFFPGDINSTILALIADKLVDQNTSIDLLNFTFNSKNTDSENGLKALQQSRPFRRWKLVKIDISTKELNFQRDDRIDKLIYPLKPSMEFREAYELWFASRGWAGEYNSLSRVLLVAFGSDELFEYCNATDFNSKWNKLLQKLGMYDRMVGDHKKLMHAPYLEKNFMKYVRGLKPWERIYSIDNMMEGKGDKFLLRCLGFYLGLKNAATL